MNVIGFNRQNALVKEVTDSVLDPEHPACWNIVIPPAFGEDTFCERLTERLLIQRPKPLVAVIGADEIKNSTDYVDMLHRKWHHQVVGRSAGALSKHPTSLEELMLSIGSEYICVQILNRFHKFLHRLDVSILGTLRTEEHRHRLRTVTVSPVPYYELKRIWDRDHLLMNSDYGDTHNIRQVAPPSIQEAKYALRDLGIAEDIIEYIYEITGGYPEPFSSVIRQWLARGKPSFDNKELERARKTAEEQLFRFVDWLDRPYAGSRFRDLVIDLYQGFQCEESYLRLACHPWKHILFSDDSLRAECVGRAAVTLMIKEALQKGEEDRIHTSLVNRAILMYDRKQYAVALRLLDARQTTIGDYLLEILQGHALAMSNLYGCEGHQLGTDTNWANVQKSIAICRGILKRHRHKLRRSEQIEFRYQELEEFSMSILKAQKLNNRVVDVLAGLLNAKQEHVCHKAAVTLLLLQYEASQLLPGHNSACQSATALPEQIFRVWAFWSLGLNYYSTPDKQEDTWELARKNWPHGLLQSAQVGQQFLSLESFAYFALALYLRSKPEDKVPIERDFKSLTKSLGILMPVRRDYAHAVSIHTGRQRKSFFEIIDAWLNSLILVSPDHLSREQMLAIVEPLPIVDL